MKSKVPDDNLRMRMIISICAFCACSETLFLLTRPKYDNCGTENAAYKQTGSSKRCRPVSDAAECGLFDVRRPASVVCREHFARGHGRCSIFHRIFVILTQNVYVNKFRSSLKIGHKVQKPGTILEKTS